jgi:hypothetical protein
MSRNDKPKRKGWKPVSPQVRKALRGKLGARIKSVRNERWTQQRVLKKKANRQ